MNEKKLSTNDLGKLRAAGLIFENETALRVDDVVVAIDSLTNSRRVIQTSGLMLECSRVLLCD